MSSEGHPNVCLACPAPAGWLGALCSGRPPGRAGPARGSAAARPCRGQGPGPGGGGGGSGQPGGGRVGVCGHQSSQGLCGSAGKGLAPHMLHPPGLVGVGGEGLLTQNVLAWGPHNARGSQRRGRVKRGRGRALWWAAGPCLPLAHRHLLHDPARPCMRAARLRPPPTPSGAAVGWRPHAPASKARAVHSPCAPFGRATYMASRLGSSTSAS